MAPGPPCSWSKIAPHDEDKDVFKKCTPAQCRLISSGLFYLSIEEPQRCKSNMLPRTRVQSLAWARAVTMGKHSDSQMSAVGGLEIILQ